MERRALVERKTSESDIRIELEIDGNGTSDINTGIGFFDHMLTLWCAHGLFNTSIRAQGDLYVDGHHTVEDTGILLGQAVAKALANKSGITRYGNAMVPMDEALVLVALDISNRPFLVFDVTIPSQQVGSFDTELVEEFLRAFAQHAGITLHIKMLSGKNSHHIIEAIFKALGRALDMATKHDDRVRGVPSTKGML